MLQCLVIGEITCPHLIIVLNKIDLIPEPTRATQIEKVALNGMSVLMLKHFSSYCVLVKEEICSNN